jgi:hypothetical protein
MSADLCPRIRTSALVRRVRSASLLVSALDGTMRPRTRGRAGDDVPCFTRKVRLSGELGHRSYPRLLPEGTAAFHRDNGCSVLRATGVVRPGPDPLSYVGGRR